MTTYTVRFRVGSDRQIVRTAVTLHDGEGPAAMRRKIAAAGLTSPWQFPASAVQIIDAAPIPV